MGRRARWIVEVFGNKEDGDGEEENDGDGW